MSAWTHEDERRSGGVHTADKLQGVAFLAMLLGAAGADGSIVFAAVMVALAAVLVWLSYRV